MSDSTIDAPTELHRHPVRAFFWSLPLALGIVLILIVTKVIELSLTPMIGVFVVVLFLGTAWGMFGPAKKPKGPPPVAASSVEPEISRFDDFTDPVEPEGAEPASADAGDIGDVGGDGGDGD